MLDPFLERADRHLKSRQKHRHLELTYMRVSYIARCEAKNDDEVCVHRIHTMHEPTRHRARQLSSYCCACCPMYICTQLRVHPSPTYIPCTIQQCGFTKATQLPCQAKPMYMYGAQAIALTNVDQRFPTFFRAVASRSSKLLRRLSEVDRSASSCKARHRRSSIRLLSEYRTKRKIATIPSTRARWHG